MNVRSLTSRLNTTSVSTGSSNCTKAQPASRRATSSSRRTLTTSTARCSRVGYALSETPLTHIDRARMYGPGRGTMIGLRVCWRRNMNSSSASGRRGRIVSTTVSFLMENAGASAALRARSYAARSSTRSMISARVRSLTPSSLSATNEWKLSRRCSPSLTMSTPASSWYRRASSTAWSATRSNSSAVIRPPWRLRSASSSQLGRDQLPTTVTGKRGSPCSVIAFLHARCPSPSADPRARPIRPRSHRSCGLGRNRAGGESGMCGPSAVLCGSR